VKAPIKSVKLYWHSPWLYLLVPINVLVYLIVGLIARRTVSVSPGLCEVHSAKRRRRLFLFLGLGAGTCVLATGLLLGERSDLALCVFALAILLLLVGMLSLRKVYAKKITKEYARLGGCGEPFLASLE